MKNQLMTREQYVAKKAGEWAEMGLLFKEARESSGLTLADVAPALGVSPSTLRRFELGHPVKSAKIIQKAYEMYFNLNAHVFVDEMQRAELHAEYLIDQEIGGTGKIVIKRKQYTEVGVIDTGNPELNVELAIGVCKSTGSNYFFMY
ncbi:helix-turn-helix domain-containing protein [Paenibacillus silvae]|uniref:helix-turn-helix domain-containing protein n=1 Tax=Paenibacillus silvae TaxID=1325358 RepID=UPI0020067580|nr:helix-turn-helix transcriptional regulator [Paenibacillus silvae]MCK6076274.1 helix-turn-helix domain-containing protein [Paenibacillus silvae]MCK6150567.1 helix-turn-helix domain-containing protein [Paenibacillus silvae]MCK6268827.1 helix-turn-helix domain-containing protein [Paenibacillus silvae]MCK6270420.1 helix-turn-helix domain-containing protein [Paenibacillus silvae]